jgi:hypothetical protein
VFLIEVVELFDGSIEVELLRGGESADQHDLDIA